MSQFSSSSTPFNPNKINYENRILDMDRYNGRINLMELPDSQTRFQMYEKIAVRNKATEYRDAVTGVIEDNLLSKVFFSEGNIQILQNGLRAGVHRMSKEKFVIPPQNINSLQIIMRSMYMQYAEHSNTESITSQVEKLNHLVLDYVVPTLYNETMGYMKYLEDQSTLVQPMERAKLVDRDYKQLELKKWF